jgi:P-type Ca2+ transporter type 2C
MTADVVLEKDDLQTMIVAVRQGRTIYENTRNAIHYLLSTNLSEILVTFGGVAAGAGQPLSPLQLLWINLVSDIFPVLALAVQPAEGDVLSHEPRDPHEPLIRREDLQRIGMESAIISGGGLAAYGWGLARYGVGPQAGTMAFLSLTTAQVLHMLTARSPSHSLFAAERPPSNRYLTGALAAGLGLQAFTLLPGVRRLLGVAPLGVLDVAVCLAGATAPLAINEGLKLRRLPAPASAASPAPSS